LITQAFLDWNEDSSTFSVSSVVSDELDEDEELLDDDEDELDDDDDEDCWLDDDED